MFEKRSKFFALSDEGNLATFVFAMPTESTLSVFVDESGRFQFPDKESPYYIISLVMHDQRIPISSATIFASSRQRRYDNIFCPPLRFRAAPKGHARGNDRGRTQVTTVTHTTHNRVTKVDQTPRRCGVSPRRATTPARQGVVRHASAPVRHAPPPPRHDYNHHHHHDNDTGIVTFAASLVGGLVGGLISAAF